MFEHPQLADLRQRKWDLVAKSTSLRDDLAVEAAALEKWSTWMELGMQVVALSGKKLNWTWGIFGLASIWVYQNVFTEKGSLSFHPLVNRVMNITQKAIAGWKIFQNIKRVWESKVRRRPLELEE